MPQDRDPPSWKALSPLGFSHPTCPLPSHTEPASKLSSNCSIPSGHYRPHHTPAPEVTSATPQSSFLERSGSLPDPSLRLRQVSILTLTGSKSRAQAKNPHCSESPCQQAAQPGRAGAVTASLLPRGIRLLPSSHTSPLLSLCLAEAQERCSRRKTGAQ